MKKLFKLIAFKSVKFITRIASTILFAGESFKQNDVIKPHFTYCDYSETLRLMPHNYLIAYRNMGHYVPDIDGAIKNDRAIKIFLVLRELKFEGDKNKVIEHLNRTLN